MPNDSFVSIAWKGRPFLLFNTQIAPAHEHMFACAADGETLHPAEPPLRLGTQAEQVREVAQLQSDRLE